MIKGLSTIPLPPFSFCNHFSRSHTTHTVYLGGSPLCPLHIKPAGHVPTSYRRTEDWLTPSRQHSGPCLLSLHARFWCPSPFIAGGSMLTQCARSSISVITPNQTPPAQVLAIPTQSNRPPTHSLSLLHWLHLPFLANTVFQASATLTVTSHIHLMLSCSRCSSTIIFAW
jgi:hypothetical protein